MRESNTSFIFTLIRLGPENSGTRTRLTSAKVDSPLLVKSTSSPLFPHTHVYTHTVSNRHYAKPDRHGHAMVVPCTTCRRRKIKCQQPPLDPGASPTACELCVKHGFPCSLVQSEDSTFVREDRSTSISGSVSGTGNGRPILPRPGPRGLGALREGFSGSKRRSTPGQHYAGLNPLSGSKVSHPLPHFTIPC